jgi:cysteine synthase A
LMRKRIKNNVTEYIGKTPLVYLNNMGITTKARLAAKLEYFNPSGSLKDRIVFNMITDAEKRVLLTKDSILVEPTSGNTGISLAFICSVKKYKLMITVPDTISLERQKLLSSFGTELIITPGKKGMRGAIEKAEEIAEKNKNAIMLQQFNNPSNPEAHEKTTAVEIWEDTGKEVDIIIAGVGTGGTITGIGHYLKKKKKDIQIVAVEPESSAVLSGRKPGKHRIQGIGPGFIPRVLDRNVIDEVITVSDEEAVKMCRIMSKQEGLFAGFSSGAAGWAALKLANRKENSNKLIVAIFPDNGEKYYSTGLYP